MVVRFWGVRGSVAVSGDATVRTGGNTPCVELVHGGERLVLDGGTGLNALGARIHGPVDATLLFTHVHWDHIQGVPFFAPAYHPQSRLRLIGAARPSGDLRAALEAQMRPPTFPVTLAALRAQLEFGAIEPGEVLRIGAFEVVAADLEHPDGVLAYRISAGGASVVFATDVEHGPSLDPRLVELARGADLLIHDAMYTPAEYAGEVGAGRVGWGHSTWDDAARLAERGRVGRLALFHHDPSRTDDAVAEIEQRARRVFPATLAAREGLRVAL